MEKQAGTALHLLLPVIAVAIFCLAVWVLVREAHAVDLKDIVTEFRALPAGILVASGVLATFSYGILTLYDFLALRYIGAALPYRKVAPVSFSAFAIGHNVGLASLSGGAIRYRAYSLAGLTAPRIALVVGFLPVTFGLGAAILLGITLMVDPAALKILPAGQLMPQLLGALLLLIPLLYVTAIALKRTPVELGSWAIPTPGVRIAVSQCLLGCADLVAASSVLFVLLQSAVDVAFLPFLGAFLLAMVAGIISNVPGAIGVFESAMLLLLPEIPVALLLGSILAYRLIYYLVPLFLALLIVVAHEVLEHKAKILDLSGKGMAWGTRLVPQSMGAAVFFVGAYLVIGTAIPLTPVEQGLATRVVPVPLLEMSHLLSSAVGVGLLLLAHGLFRRQHGAYQGTLALLLLGSVAMFIHRESLVQALILLSVLLLLWLSRAEFYRGKGLLDERFDFGWVVSIAAVLAVALGLGAFVHRHSEYSDQLWWQFTLQDDASRMLRASLLGMLIAGVFAILRLIRGHPQLEAEVDQDDLARVRSIINDSPRSLANIALLGDKKFLFHPAGDALIMYQGAGRSLISMGDPVGNPERFEELAWSFRELCDAGNSRCVFYEVGDTCLPIYIDLGLSFSKLGEEARVDLTGFDLADSSRSQLRQARNRAKREGAEFSVATASEVPGMLAELRQVSDAWLKTRGAHEKGFSLGFFSEEYLLNFDCAVIRVDGQLVAFANLWKSAELEELSVDLMRFSDAAPKGVMDYLFTELMLWGRDQGYRWFSLGMAPLSGLEQHSLAPAWNKLGNLVYRFGEHFYNFEGLRQYKQKFDPVWQPRYLASTGGIDFPGTLFDTTVLISGGVKETLFE